MQIMQIVGSLVLLVGAFLAAWLDWSGRLKGLSEAPESAPYGGVEPL
jgi:hypothetical protein